MKEKIYRIMVNRVPGIRERYQRRRVRSKGALRGTVWCYLIWLNIRYYVFRDSRLEYAEKYPDYEKKRLYGKGSESSLSCKETPQELAQRLAGYDVVSFDVFDTLLLRPFSSPADLFYVLGNELDYLDFQRIRVEMEEKARRKKQKEDKSSEVSLEEIYALLSEETGMEKESAMQKEVELEHDFCFANPYMREVVRLLREKGKRLVILSDMYLHTEQIKSLLKKCGYGEFAACYVSCDIQKSKNKGNLYDYVKKQEGGRRSFAHIGDNRVADVEHAKRHGFAPFYYRNVNTAGRTFRSYDMSVITGSIYRGLVNAHIHNGLHCYSREYEYGYIYGGLFVTGYCQFIHEYTKRRRPDKLLFLARDGDILLKAYGLLYPEGLERCEYVYWSRLAAAKLSAAHYKYDYFRRFLYHKVNQGYSIRQIFEAMELEDMVENACAETLLTPDTLLTEGNVEKLKRYLAANWQQALAHYAGQQEAAKQYYREVLEGCRKAAAVDIGWAGSGAVTLDYLVNHVWMLDCEITGILAGTNTCHNSEPDAGETFLQSGKLLSYLYSQRENRDIWKFHNPGKDHNLYWEMLLDAPAGSLKGFYLDERGRWECRFKDRKDGKGIEEIQRGILDFVNEYREMGKKIPGLEKISGRDAYAPMINVENIKNRPFTGAIRQCMDSMNVE